MRLFISCHLLLTAAAGCLVGCTTQEGLLPDPDPTVSDLLGMSVAMSGERILAGAPGGDIDSVNADAGKALVYRFGGTLWALEETLFPTMPSPMGYFGVGVDIDGDRAIVGANTEPFSPGPWGSAYIFERNGSSWMMVDRLTGDPTLHDSFGHTVRISGNYAAVRARNSNHALTSVVYVFHRNSVTGTWEQQQILASNVASLDDGFGESVSLDGDVLLVGARLSDDKGANSGSVHVFRLQGSTWVEEPKITAFDGQAGDRFGSAVGISNDLAVIGASGENENGENAGAAYVFERNPATNTWKLTAKLVADSAEDFFGGSVATDGDSIVVGAVGANGNAVNSGAAYVYRRTVLKGVWQQAVKLIGDSSGAYQDGNDDNFGRSVGVSGDCAAVGAPHRDDAAGVQQGATYVFCDFPNPLDEIVIDIICCIQPPDPLGPVVFTLRFGAGGERQSTVERWAEIRTPGGQVETVLEPDFVVAPLGEPYSERGVVRLGPDASRGTYRLTVYWKEESGILRTESVVFRH